MVFLFKTAVFWCLYGLASNFFPGTPHVLRFSTTLWCQIRISQEEFLGEKIECNGPGLLHRQVPTFANCGRPVRADRNSNTQKAKRDLRDAIGYAQMERDEPLNARQVSVALCLKCPKALCFPLRLTQSKKSTEVI